MEVSGVFEDDLAPRKDLKDTTVLRLGYLPITQGKKVFEERIMSR
jgi:hypothetical protein